MKPLIFVFIISVLYLAYQLLRSRRPKHWLIVSSSLSLAVILSFQFLGGVFLIPTESMSPTIKPGDLVIAQRVGGLFDHRAVQRGDVLVFNAPSVPGVYYVKRVLGIPGDTVTYNEDKVFSINGKQNGSLIKKDAFTTQYQAETDTAGQSYIFETDNRIGYVQTGKKWIIPEGYYFMVGDNRDHSLDSRYWDNPPGTPKNLRGLIHHESLVGRVNFKIVNLGFLARGDSGDRSIKQRQQPQQR
ncbi:peptidase (plasmid) [Citrobacter amalonaticus Y19]|uniref:Signal peptidase I n=1 Tax=Citrobacter amalonaticus Y19 TaxID=1261127 RepID=A0A0F6U0B0_CITAM|nr:signal peptidase I [Citrobacter amalonaticus]AKE62151.1 peptidase [Citrobacter amalonaticus Y19]